MANLIPKSMRRAAVGLLLLAPAVATVPSCTDLTEVPQDALTPSNAFRSDAEVLAGVASVYAGLRGMMWGYYNLSEITTDELIVPTRGQDWYDNGTWLEIYRQTWGANSGSALNDMNGAWNDLFGGVARANLMIDVISKAGGADKDRTLAELRTLRAWYYYMLQDLFGGVPLVTSTEVKQNPRATRDSVFRFIESELKAALPALPNSWPAEQSGRVTKGAANAILASLYLNAQIFTGTPTAGGITRGAPRWQDAITAADAVINSGQYSLATDYKSNFTPDNKGSRENIFYIQHTAQPGLGMTLAMRGLHYNQLGVGGGPWNGFATIAETYRAYDANDIRRDVWLAGPQRSFDTGQPVKDRPGAPLVFTETIANPDAATEGEGPRPNKFPPLPTAPAGDAHPNNYPFFRLAEMHLIKAEAMNELGQTAAAIAEVNRVRARAFANGSPLSTSMTQAQARTAIYNERLFELALEAKRRQDMIRAGTFTNARSHKLQREPFKVLFPVPATQIQSNPLLTQNPGY
jgi:starch-binding outer membrane protein, SusD/RagB family